VFYERPSRSDSLRHTTRSLSCKYRQCISSAHRYHRITYRHPSLLRSMNEAVVNRQILGYHSGADEYWVDWDTMTCSFLCSYRSFRGPWCLHVQGSPRMQTALKIETANSEMLVPVYTNQHGLISQNVNIRSPVELVRVLLSSEGKYGTGRFTSRKPMYRNLVHMGQVVCLFVCFRHNYQFCHCHVCDEVKLCSKIQISCVMSSFRLVSLVSILQIYTVSHPRGVDIHQHRCE
jgi:hypothetical protein